MGVRSTENFFFSKAEFESKLQRTGKPIGTDFLQRSEIARTRVGHQIAGLVQRHAITAVAAYGAILQRVDPVAVLHVVIGMVEQVECLHLKLQFPALPDRKTRSAERRVGKER